MKCLVTGASGFIGRELCRQLPARGATVAQTGREPPSRAQLAGVAIVYHAAGIAHRSADPADYQTCNYRATLDLAHRAADAGVQRFVFLSSVNAGEAAEPYGYWKWRTEQALLSAYAEGAMSVVILRPALVYGPGARGNLQLLIKAVRRGLPTPPAGKSRSMISVEDLCDALCRIADVDPGRGVILTATDGQSYDLQRLHRAFALALGRRPSRPWLPLWCWWAASLGADLLRRRRPGDLYTRLFDGALFSNQRLCDALGWVPRQRLEDVAGDMVGEGA